MKPFHNYETETIHHNNFFRSVTSKTVSFTRKKHNLHKMFRFILECFLETFFRHKI